MEANCLPPVTAAVVVVFLEVAVDKWRIPGTVTTVAIAGARLLILVLETVRERLARMFAVAAARANMIA